MSELSPGLHVSSWLGKSGTIYALSVSRTGLSGVAGGDTALLVHADDWERIAPADRERLLDEWTHRSADAGIDELTAWLTAEIDSGVMPATGEER